MFQRRPSPAGKTSGVIAPPIRGLLLPALAACALALLSLPATAVELGEVGAATVTGNGWRAENVELRFSDLSRSRLSAEIQISRFVLADPHLEMRGITINCAGLELSWREARCPNARVRVRSSPLDRGEFTAAVSYDFLASAAAVSARRVRAAGGTLDISLAFRPMGWRAVLKAQLLTFDGARKLASAFADVAELPQWGGLLNAEITASGDASLGAIDANVDIIEASGSNASGTAASENVAATLSVAASKSGPGWRARCTVSSKRGQLYVHPLFIDFSEHALAAEMQLSQADASRWLVDFQVQQEGIGRANGAAGFMAGAWTTPESLDLNVNEAFFPGVYLVYLQPFLVGTAADSLESIGSVKGQFRLRSGAPESVELALEDLHIDDTRNRFALYGINGELNWDATDARPSHLGWQGGYGYRIGFGPATLAFSASGNSLELQGPARIPVLDGALRINTLAIANAGLPEVSLDFDGDIEPVGMRALTRALEWPPFPGSVSGTIPRMRYSEGAVTVDGALSARVFDGTVTVEKLRLSEPLGVLPELQANVSMRRLDLAAVTSAFSFGNIEGRLDGDIRDLRMLGFSPVRFEARLYSSPGDKSRHRISQQAIENISDLGGAGAGAVLSRGMLRFFESFAYDVIGWSCVLEDEVCRMDGVAPAPGTGYYIVRGKGLPRINVIGFSRRVSWPLLVEKLREVSAGNMPEIR